MGHVAVVGLGPGGSAWCTPDVRQVLESSTDWVGYTTYVDLARAVVAPGAGTVVHASDNRQEIERARLALDLAATGRDVAVVSSGDPGIFAMAAAVFEAIDEAGNSEEAGLSHGAGRWAGVGVSVHPGITAAQAAAARAGAPLGHDFCILSLSDNLKPWSVIERRLEAVAAADLVVALYNPRSRHRPGQFARAVSVLAAHRTAPTPVVIARDVGRPDEAIRIATLSDLADPAVEDGVDMRTVVIVGSSRTRLVEAPDGRLLTYTPRTYPDD